MNTSWRFPHPPPSPPALANTSTNIQMPHVGRRDPLEHTGRERSYRVGSVSSSARRMSPLMNMVATLAAALQRV